MKLSKMAKKYITNLKKVDEKYSPIQLFSRHNVLYAQGGYLWSFTTDKAIARKVSGIPDGAILPADHFAKLFTKLRKMEVTVKEVESTEEVTKTTVTTFKKGKTEISFEVSMTESGKEFFEKHLSNLEEAVHEGIQMDEQTLKEYAGYCKKMDFHKHFEGMTLTPKITYATDANILKFSRELTTKENNVFLDMDILKNLILSETPYDLLTVTEDGVVQTVVLKSEDHIIMQTAMSEIKIVDVEAIIPNVENLEQPMKVAIPKKRLLDICNTVKVLEKNGRMVFDGDTIRLYEDKDEENPNDYREKITVEGEPFAVALDANLLLRILKYKVGENVTLTFKSPTKAILVDDDAIIMPVLIR